MTFADLKPLNIFFVGTTGAGKSRIIENLTGETGLSACGKESHTSTVTPYSAYGFTLFDTPGFGDSQGRDGVFIQELVSNMKSLKDGITLVVFCQVCESRFDQQQAKSLAMLNDIFQGKLNTNLCICLTKADKDEHKEKSLKDTLEITKNQLPVCMSFKDDSSQLLEIMKQYAAKPPLMTDFMVALQTEEKKLEGLSKELENAKSTEEIQQLENNILKAQIHELEVEKEEHRLIVRNYVKSEEKWSGFFARMGAQIGSVLDRILGLEF